MAHLHVKLDTRISKGHVFILRKILEQEKEKVKFPEFKKAAREPGLLLTYPDFCLGFFYASFGE